MLTLQPLILEDIEAVSKIEAACFSMPWSAKALAQVLEDPHSLYVTAKEDGVIVGFCGVTDICGDGEIVERGLPRPCFPISAKREKKKALSTLPWRYAQAIRQLSMSTKSQALCQWDCVLAFMTVPKRML